MAIMKCVVVVMEYGQLLSTVGARVGDALGLREGVEGGLGMKGRCGGDERWWRLWLWWLAVVTGFWRVCGCGCGCGWKFNCELCFFIRVNYTDHP